MKHITGILLLALCLAGCEGHRDVVSPLSLDKTYYEVRWGRGEATIPITNGSGDISLTVADGSILQASYQKKPQADGAIGTVTLQGKRKGTTTLTLTDNVTQDEATVDVKITDCYLAYTVDESNCPILVADATLFFINNEARTYHLFASDSQQLAMGTYEFLVKQDDDGSALPSLRLNCSSDMPQEFALSFNNPQACLNIIQGYLGVDWDALIHAATTKSTVPQRFTMTLTDPASGYETTGTFSTASFPEHVLE